MMMQDGGMSGRACGSGKEKAVSDNHYTENEGGGCVLECV